MSNELWFIAITYNYNGCSNELLGHKVIYHHIHQVINHHIHHQVMYYPLLNVIVHSPSDIPSLAWLIYHCGDVPSFIQCDGTLLGGHDGTSIGYLVIYHHIHHQVMYHPLVNVMGHWLVIKWYTITSLSNIPSLGKLIYYYIHQQVMYHHLLNVLMVHCLVNVMVYHLVTNVMAYHYIHQATTHHIHQEMYHHIE